MAKVRFELNRKGVRELMRGEAMQGILQSYAEAVQQRVGDGYELTTHVGVNRANASVHAASEEAYQDTLKNNSLLKALH